MRNLPSKPSKEQKKVIKATYDFFGCMTIKEKSKAKKIALWIMRRRKGNKLEKEDFIAVWCIRRNLSDNLYQKSLSGD